MADDVQPQQWANPRVDLAMGYAEQLAQLTAAVELCAGWFRRCVWRARRGDEVGAHHAKVIYGIRDQLPVLIERFVEVYHTLANIEWPNHPREGDDQNILNSEAGNNKNHPADPEHWPDVPGEPWMKR